MKLLVEKVYNNYVIQIASNYNFGNNKDNELQSGFAIIDELTNISVGNESEELSKDLLSITKLTKNIEDATYFTDKEIASRFSNEIKRRVTAFVNEQNKLIDEQNKEIDERNKEIEEINKSLPNDEKIELEKRKDRIVIDYSASVQKTDLRINTDGTPEEFLESLPWTRTTKDTIKNDCMQQFNTILNSYGRDINDNPFLVYISNLDSKYGNGKYNGPAFTITPRVLNILLNTYGKMVDLEDFTNTNEDNIFMDNYFTRLTNSEQIGYIIQVYTWFQNSYNVRNYITDDVSILKQFGVTSKDDVKTLCMNVLKQGGKGEYNPAKVIENNLLKLENKSTSTLSSSNRTKDTVQIRAQSKNSERWKKMLSSVEDRLKELSADDRQDLLAYINGLSSNDRVGG